MPDAIFAGAESLPFQYGELVNKANTLRVCKPTGSFERFAYFIAVEGTAMVLVILFECRLGTN